MDLKMLSRTAFVVCSAVLLACTKLNAQQPAHAQDATATLEVNVDRVLVPVVVRDKQGHTVDGLTQADFQLFDDGKLRPITGFLVEKRGVAQTGTLGNSGSAPTLPAAANAVPQADALPNRVTVFLFDDMHLSYEDIAHAREAALKDLDGVLTGSDVAAVVSTSGKVNSGLTNDRATLDKAINSVRPEGIYRANANDCPKMDYYQADLIENKRDPIATNDALSQVMNVCDPNTTREIAQRIVDMTAMRTVQTGAQDVRTTYAAIGEFVRRMAKLPGERSLILISPGFLPVEEEARAEESQVMDLAAQSDVTISALDARGLYTASVTASEDTRGRDPGLVADYLRTSMKQEEDAMGELADGTGGEFFGNNNDLEAGLKRLTEAPEVLYVLELSLNGVKANGTLHRLKVKVDRPGVSVEARRGYFMPRPEKRKKK
jgi:VWFA-related protein